MKELEIADSENSQSVINKIPISQFKECPLTNADGGKLVKNAEAESEASNRPSSPV